MVVQVAVPLLGWVVQVLQPQKHPTLFVFVHIHLASVLEERQEELACLEDRL